MMTASLLGTTLLLLAGWPACARDGAAAGGKTFRLKVGESSPVAETDFEIGFDGVPSDSRCPKNVQCVWAGEAKVVLWARTASGERTELTFTVPPGGGASQTYRKAEIRIVGLEPQTESGKRIARGDYVVEITVEGERH
jgi:hypothetical protein